MIHARLVTMTEAVTVRHRCLVSS